MSDDLSTVDARQLEAWAYGRDAASSDVAAARAEAAQIELGRRADALADAARIDAARVAAEQIAVDQAAAGDRLGADRGGAHQGGAHQGGDGDDADGEHPETPESIAAARHRQRMRATGMVGVIAAVLGLGVVSTALSAPNPDPLAIFDRPETQQDRDWAIRLAQGFTPDITAGPRAFELGDDIIAVAFRTAAVADGRSTEFDPYCLVTSDLTSVAGASSYGGACALPEKFVAEGLAIQIPTPYSGDGLGAVTWGPTGAPQLTMGFPPVDDAAPMSVIDGMVYGSFSEPGVDPLAMVDDPDRLLLGPAPLPLVRTEPAAMATSTVTYLEGDTSDSAGPVFCAHTTVPDEEETRVCALLSTVRRQGLEYTVTIDGQLWVVSIGADGPDRQDTMQAAE